MQQFSLITLGCKVNQYDSNAIATLLRRAGWSQPKRGKKTNLVIINTCCVTTTAMRKSRQAIRKAVGEAPGAAVLVTGCYSDLDAPRIRKFLAEMRIPPTRIIIEGYHGDLPLRLKSLLQEQSPNPSLDACEDEVGGPGTIASRRNSALRRKVSPASRLSGIDRFDRRQRAFVKVQDGCDAFCSYCIVPYTRPRVWSRPIDEVEAESRRLVAAGHKEIVLSGVFLGAFGRSTALRRRWAKNEPAKLPQLLERIARIEGLWRVRLSSLEPGDVTDELLDVCSRELRVAPHFHLPLQSGSERILRRMNRQYTTTEFRRTVQRIREILDHPAITTDIIVGFPGATDADFSETLDMVRFAAFTKIHAFPFSPVEPTVAWKWRGEAPPSEIVRARLQRLRELEKETANVYRRSFINQEMEGLVERARPGEDGLRRAMTDRYLKVAFQGPDSGEELTGKIVKLRVERASAEGLDGVLTGAPTMFGVK